MARLVFGPGKDPDELSLSGAAAVGEHLFLAPDEGTSIVRMTRTADGDYSAPTRFPVSDLVDVPGDPGDELDLEGMDQIGDYLWFIGSHSDVRTRVKTDTTTTQVATRLAEIKHPKSRRLLARVPLQGDTGIPTAVAITATGDRLHAARLSTKDEGGLIDLLRRDEHLGPFVGIPGKDNGLDIEGLAALPSRLLIGLRGPVLRGWAILLEINPQPDPANSTRLRLEPLDGAGGPRYRKHFLDLDGLGVRDLTCDGDDLFVLAGPTMLIDGPSRVLRVPHGAVRLPDAVHRSDLVQVGADLHVGHGSDHPEAITAVTAGRDGAKGLLIAYDTPQEHLLSDGVTIDVLALPV
jgi:hypothetical protein